MSNEPDFSKERLPTLKAVRLKCLDCCGFSRKEVTNCKIKRCPLWAYRNGKRNIFIKKSESTLSYFIKKLKSIDS